MDRVQQVVVDELLQRLADDEQALDRFLDAPITTLEEFTGEPADEATLRAVSAGLQERAQEKGATPLSDEALDEVVGALTFSSRLWNSKALLAIPIHAHDHFTTTISIRP